MQNATLTTCSIPGHRLRAPVAFEFERRERWAGDGSGSRESLSYIVWLQDVQIGGWQTLDKQDVVMGRPYDDYVIAADILRGLIRRAWDEREREHTPESAKAFLREHIVPIKEDVGQ